MELFEKAKTYPDRAAIITPVGIHTYGALLRASEGIASLLLGDASDLGEARIAFPANPDFDYVSTLWGIWRAGGIAVPLPREHPLAELHFALSDAEVTQIVATPDYLKFIRPIAGASRLTSLETGSAESKKGVALPDIAACRRALILYTSGTTGKPKGVVSTHANISAQASSLIEAWEWSGEDHILHVLPLHHVHGIVNLLICALRSGAVCEFLPRFQAEAVWNRLLRGDITLFMAVPTIYAKLIASWESARGSRQREISSACASLRLMVSGSAPLPASVFQKWESITGHQLLERYGMTEIGMALSCPLHSERKPGFVGTPLPRVELRCVDDRGDSVPPGSPGEIEVYGPSVFREYWGSEEATEAAFHNGWFRTGDIATLVNGSYRILGRKDVDIIKTGGYKVSALEIEERLRRHPIIVDCAVVGVQDDTWGEVVSAGIVYESGGKLSLESLHHWAKDQLATYKVPRRILALKDLPTNAMGKVDKAALKSRFAQSP